MQTVFLFIIWDMFMRGVDKEMPTISLNTSKYIKELQKVIKNLLTNYLIYIEFHMIHMILRNGCILLEILLA